MTLHTKPSRADLELTPEDLTSVGFPSKSLIAPLIKRVNLMIENQGEDQFKDINMSRRLLVNMGRIAVFSLPREFPKPHFSLDELEELGFAKSDLLVVHAELYFAQLSNKAPKVDDMQTLIHSHFSHEVDSATLGLAKSSGLSIHGLSGDRVLCSKTRIREMATDLEYPSQSSVIGLIKNPPTNYDPQFAFDKNELGEVRPPELNSKTSSWKFKSVAESPFYAEYGPDGKAMCFYEGTSPEIETNIDLPVTQRAVNVPTNCPEFRCFQMYADVKERERKDTTPFFEKIGKDFVVIDTETNRGFKEQPEAIELSVRGSDGEEVLFSRIKPTRSVTDGAFRVHGISNEELEDAPTINELFPKMQEVFKDKKVVIYNSDFDLDVLKNSFELAGITPEQSEFIDSISANSHCLMKEYARVYGKPQDRDDRPGAYRYQSLGASLEQQHIQYEADALHGSSEDTKQTLNLLNAIRVPERVRTAPDSFGPDLVFQAPEMIQDSFSPSI